MDKRMILNTVISATVGGLIGGVVTYLTVKKTFEERLRVEVDEVKKFYSILRKEDGSLQIFGGNVKEDPEPDGPLNTHEITQKINIHKAEEIIERQNYSIISKETNDDSDEETPDFTIDGLPPGNIWDQDTRIKEYEREEGKPYIISVSEFEEGERGQTRDEMTYYEGDDTLCDKLDQLVDNIEYVIGIRHLDMFGVKSNDPNVVYIRNENNGVDYEVTRHRGEYTVQVLRLGPSDLGTKTPKQRPLRMRDDD